MNSIELLNLHEGSRMCEDHGGLDLTVCMQTRTNKLRTVREG